MNLTFIHGLLSLSLMTFTAFGITILDGDEGECRAVKVKCEKSISNVCFNVASATGQCVPFWVPNQWVDEKPTECCTFDRTGCELRNTGVRLFDDCETGVGTTDKKCPTSGWDPGFLTVVVNKGKIFCTPKPANGSCTGDDVKDKLREQISAACNVPNLPFDGAGLCCDKRKGSAVGTPLEENVLSIE